MDDLAIALRLAGIALTLRVLCKTPFYIARLSKAAGIFSAIITIMVCGLTFIFSLGCVFPFIVGHSSVVIPPAKLPEIAKVLNQIANTEDVVIEANTSADKISTHFGLRTGDIAVFTDVDHRLTLETQGDSNSPELRALTRRIIIALNQHGANISANEQATGKPFFTSASC